jgi:hypothetical protein
MKLFPQLAFTAASLALTLATLGAKSASAAIVNYAFTVDSNVTQGKGFFSFDDSTFSNDNFPVASVKLLNLKFDNDPNVYTEKDDIEYPNYPVAYSTVSLTDKAPIGLLYSFLDKANPAKSYEINGYDFAITSVDSKMEGKVSYRVVPEPSTLGGTIIFGSIGWLMKRKVKSIKKVKA